jgi:hypothetical protein
VNYFRGGSRIRLGSLGEYGFALAGGYALQAHGLVQRISEDVDLFTDLWDMHTSESRVVDLDSLFV